jgi:hypothetical protein
LSREKHAIGLFRLHHESVNSEYRSLRKRLTMFLKLSGCFVPWCPFPRETQKKLLHCLAHQVLESNWLASNLFAKLHLITFQVFEAATTLQHVP